MIPWMRALRQGAWAGSLASMLSALALAVAGHRREGEPFAPVNAISHWVWGDPALREDGADLRHTALGYLIHHGASLFWSTLHAQAWSGARAPRTPAHALGHAAVTAAVACFVDYRLTPRRFTPGFEHRLHRKQMAAVYGCFALGLALGTLLSMQHEDSVKRRVRNARQQQET
jgi:hypothetical protein